MENRILKTVIANIGLLCSHSKIEILESYMY